MAEGSDVWRFINLKLSSPSLVPSKPTKPTAQMIKKSATSLVDLNVEERELFKLILADFKEDELINKQT
jgi:hypothetical protein